MTTYTTEIVFRKAHTEDDTDSPLLDIGDETEIGRIYASGPRPFIALIARESANAFDSVDDF